MYLKDYNLNFLYDYPKKKDNKFEMINPNNLDDSKKISAVSDVMFKTLFFNENRLKYSSKLLSFLVDASYEELCENLKLDKESLDKNNYYEKGQTVDYVARIKDTFLNIELNNSSDPTVMKRNILYAFRLMNRNNKRKNKDKEITKLQTIQINLNNFAFEGIDKVVDIYTIRNEEDITLSDTPIIIQIYLPNLQKKVYNGVNKLSYFERLLLVYMESDIKTCEDIGQGDKFMEEFIKDAKDASHEDEILSAYDKEWETRLWGYEEGRKKEKEEIVRNMLKEKMDISLIKKVTELSEKEILEIKEKAE